MSFTVTIHNIPDAQLGALIARVNAPKTMRLEVMHVDATVPTTNGKGAKATDETVLRMTGKTPRIDTILHEGIVIFEKLEAEHGIGTVTIGQFRDLLRKRKKSKDLYTRLHVEGYLAYVR